MDSPSGLHKLTCNDFHVPRYQLDTPEITFEREPMGSKLYRFNLTEAWAAVGSATACIERDWMKAHLHVGIMQGDGVDPNSPVVHSKDFKAGIRLLLRPLNGEELTLQQVMHVHATLLNIGLPDTRT